ncbi:helix-turn-helix transcriptional regulator [Paraneptunicella aestuarii]|uniref:helix-turn-helix domain-containing protein n=1 Tax=Paraneptunicella aestuarii TaxID=2831148 RepID=UPI001E555725|nr:helix-turn-helix transcriptional regulator [Paraneptunicella aestuarii]UAA39136.1 helix-turn-helix transcriptional regulator [Paraneptunicella aestuarii]
MTRITELHKEWLKDDEYKQEYNKLEAEFNLAKVLIQAREKSGLSQSEIAKRMNTKQSVVARLESANGNPTIKTLSRYAEALGGHLEISIGR